MKEHPRLSYWRLRFVNRLPYHGLVLPLLTLFDIIGGEYVFMPCPSSPSYYITSSFIYVRVWIPYHNDTITLSIICCTLKKHYYTKKHQQI